MLAAVRKMIAARRVVENAFALLVARWRLLKNEIQAKPEYVEIYTKACCILHNYLQSESGGDQFDVDFDTETENLLPVEPSLSNLKSNSGGITSRILLKSMSFGPTLTGLKNRRKSLKKIQTKLKT